MAVHFLCFYLMKKIKATLCRYDMSVAINLVIFFFQHQQATCVTASPSICHNNPTSFFSQTSILLDQPTSKYYLVIACRNSLLPCPIELKYVYTFAGIYGPDILCLLMLDTYFILCHIMECTWIGIH